MCANGVRRSCATLSVTCFTSPINPSMRSSIRLRFSASRSHSSRLPCRGIRWPRPLCMIARLVALMASIRRMVRRIEAINATSRAIMQSGLGQRIARHGSRDEWDLLAENLNLMLDRIEGLMGEVKQVTDNVAHDLRTPLAHMRGRLEKAYASPRNREHDQSLIGDTMAD